MSMKPWLFTLTMLAFVGALGGVVGASLLGGDGGGSTTRGPASVAETASVGKSAHFHPSSLKVTKPNQSLEASIEAVGGFPQTNDQTAHLQAMLTPHLPEGTWVNYRWVLPDGASLDSGNLDGQLQVTADQPNAYLDLSVRGFSSEGGVRNVRLELTVADQNIGNTLVFSSHPTRSDLTRGYRESKTGRSSDPAAKGLNKPRLPAGVRL